MLSDIRSVRLLKEHIELKLTLPRLSSFVLVHVVHVRLAQRFSPRSGYVSRVSLS